MSPEGPGNIETGEAVSSRRAAPFQWNTLATDMVAGMALGGVALPICVIAGVLAYEPLGPAYAGIGAAAGIICGAVGGVVGAFARTSSFVPNLPSSTMSLILASFIAAVGARSGGDVALMSAMLPIAVLLGGIFQGLIAASGLARAVKFTPYPVLAGFLTGVAVLIIVQQLPRLFGVPSLDALARAIGSLSLGAPGMPLFGFGIVLLIAAVERHAPRVPSLLVALLAGTALFHLMEAVLPDVSLGETIGRVSIEQVRLGLSLEPALFLQAFTYPDILRSLLLTSATIAILGTLDLTFSLRGAQDLADVELAPVRNLAAQGVSNAAAALAGGVSVTSSFAIGRSIFAAGGRTRAAPVALAGTLLALALLAPGLISALPNVILAAILVSISFKLWDRWCISLVRDLVRGGDVGARLRARRNSAIVATVAAATVLGQPVVGALVGIVLSCLVFILEMSRPAVRRRLDGTRLFSKRIRSQQDGATLRRFGGRTAIFELQGVLFFGNADDLATAIREAETAIDAAILDLGRVTDLDTSGATVLAQIAARCRTKGIALLVAGLRPDFEAVALDAIGRDGWTLVFPDLDSALETAENRTLANAASDDPWRALNLEQTDFAGGLSERELGVLRLHMVSAAYPPGAALCRAGEPADRLWLLTRGSVSVRLPGSRSAKRIAGLGPGTSVGELGLLDRRPRSADVVADEEVEAWVLTAEGFDALLRNEPHLGQSLLATIARMTAQRLRTTSDELALTEN